MNRFMLDYENGIQIIIRSKANNINDLRIPGRLNENLRGIAQIRSV